MSTKRTLTSAALCLTFACFGSSAVAESGSGLEDAVIKADEAAEAEALAAEAMDEEAVVLDEVEAAEEAEKAKEAAERGQKAFMDSKK